MLILHRYEIRSPIHGGGLGWGACSVCHVATWYGNGHHAGPNVAVGARSGPVAIVYTMPCTGQLYGCISLTASKPKLTMP